MHRVVIAVLLLIPGLAPARSAVPIDVDSVMTAGSWRRGGESGTYRVILRNDGWEHRWTHLVVQWISSPASREEEPKVVAEVEPELPTGAGYFVLQTRLFPERQGHARVRVTASDNGSADRNRPVRFEILLNAPGEVVLPPQRTLQ